MSESDVKADTATAQSESDTIPNTMSLAWIDSLEKPYKAAAEKAYEEAMARLRYQDENQKSLDQKAGLLLGALSATTTTLIIFIANNAIKSPEASAAAAGAAVIAFVALILCLISLSPRDWMTPVTKPEHWIHKEPLKDQHGLSKHLLKLAYASESWSSVNLKAVREKGSWLAWAFNVTAAIPVGGCVGYIVFKMLT